MALDFWGKRTEWLSSLRREREKSGSESGETGNRDPAGRVARDWKRSASSQGMRGRPTCAARAPREMAHRSSQATKANEGTGGRSRSTSSSTTPSRSKMGGKSAGIAPRLSPRTSRPHQSSSRRYSSRESRRRRRSWQEHHPCASRITKCGCLSSCDGVASCTASLFQTEVLPTQDSRGGFSLDQLASLLPMC